MRRCRDGVAFAMAKGQHPRAMRRFSCLLALLLGLSACSDSNSEATDAGHDAGHDAGRDGGEDDVPDAFTECSATEDAAVSIADAGPGVVPEAIDCGEPFFAEDALHRYPYLQNAQLSSVRVLWATTSGGDGEVRVREADSEEWLNFPTNADLFPTDATGETTDFIQYEAEVTGLEAGTEYCYEVWEEGERLAGGLHLNTRWEGETERPVRFFALGDSGAASDGQRNVRDAFVNYEHDFALHLGDIAYGDGTFTEFETKHFAIYREQFAHQVLWPTIGNHDQKTDAAGPYKAVFSLPEVALREADQERYYSFDYGNVHFVSLDSNDATLIPLALAGDSMDDDMLDWLAADLAASDAPWKIAFFHHPPYTSSSRRPNAAVRNVILPLLEEGGVDLVLVGHDHHYERTLPMREGCVAQGDDSAITYIVAGASGAGLRGDVTPQYWHQTSNDEIHSFVRFEILGCTLHGQAIAADGSVIEEFDLDGCE